VAFNVEAGRVVQMDLLVDPARLERVRL
jgi:hypothetical protein